MGAELSAFAKQVFGRDQRIDGGEAPVRRCQVLVVDDENGPRQSLRMLLKEEYDVLMAPSVDDALDLLEEESIDLVITDIRMPRKTGVDLLREVKRGHPDLQVIILTGYGQLDSAMKAVEYGAFAYLEKPFDSNAMLTHVRAALVKYDEEKERRALERLALEANRFQTLGRVVSGMIHDLGTPLSVLGSHTDMLKMNADRSDIDERLDVMKSQVKHCSDIVRSTMNFLRHQPQSEAPFSINDAANTCLELSQFMLTRQSVAVEVDLEEGLPYCMGDFVLIRQAILNLITNACHAMHDQQEPQSLAVKTWREGGNVILAVTDSGPGIPAEKRERVFETFYTTKGEDGTGLGLAVVRNVIQRHCGEVRLVDHEGRGARFVVKLPCCAPSNER